MKRLNLILGTGVLAICLALPATVQAQNSASDNDTTMLQQLRDRYSDGNNSANTDSSSHSKKQTNTRDTQTKKIYRYREEKHLLYGVEMPRRVFKNIEDPYPRK